jgi:hypothetical protein
VRSSPQLGQMTNGRSLAAFANIGGMPLYYVTGVSGSGKSAVLRALQVRGHEAHGVDEHGFGIWINRETGEVATFPKSPANVEIHRWYDEHTWTLDEAEIRTLRSHSDEIGRPVFLCGTAEGDSVVWDAFNKVFALIVDAETIKKRIKQRPDRFGKRSDELTRILEWQKSFEENYRRFGAVIVDATRPVEAVVDELLATVGQHAD